MEADQAERPPPMFDTTKYYMPPQREMPFSVTLFSD
jgi:hypothetical protein